MLNNDKQIIFEEFKSGIHVSTELQGIRQKKTDQIKKTPFIYINKCFSHIEHFFNKRLKCCNLLNQFSTASRNPDQEITEEFV